MEPTHVARTELVGKTQNNTAVLEALVRANALNRTGDIDYNNSKARLDLGLAILENLG